jgi:hypothetical protein
MIPSLAQAISERPIEELREMLDTARTKAQRTQFEVEVIEEALSNAQDRPSPKSPTVAASPSNGRTPQEVRDLVLSIVGELGPVPPKSVAEAIGDDSVNVYNPLGRLVKEGKLTREDGIYAVPTASVSGQHPSHLAGPNGQGPPQSSPHRPIPEGENAMS